MMHSPSDIGSPKRQSCGCGQSLAARIVRAHHSSHRDSLRPLHPPELTKHLFQVKKNSKRNLFSQEKKKLKQTKIPWHPTIRLTDGASHTKPSRSRFKFK